METQTKKRTLLELAEDIQALDDLMEEIGGDVTEEQVAAYVEQLFGETADNFNEKVDRYCALIRQKELIIIAIKAEIDQLQARLRTETNHVSHLKGWLMTVMQRLGMPKAGKVRTASICNNGGKQPMTVDTVPIDQVPERFIIVRREIDTAAVREALENKEALTFARLEERGQHLRIR